MKVIKYVVDKEYSVIAEDLKTLDRQISMHDPMFSLVARIDKYCEE